MQCALVGEEMPVLQGTAKVPLQRTVSPNTEVGPCDEQVNPAFTHIQLREMSAHPSHER